MDNGKLKWVAVLGLALSLLLAGVAWAQKLAPEKGAAPPQGRAVVYQGKIIHSQDFGGYVLITENPHEEHKIVNENPKVLAPLAKAAKTVAVEGRLVHGAYLLIIDKIDGKKYAKGK